MINMEVVDQAVVNKHYKLLRRKGKPPTLEKKISLLEKYFSDNAKNKEDIVQCDQCQGFSSLELDDCPFCGDKDPEGLKEIDEKIENAGSSPANEAPEEEEPAEAAPTNGISKAIVVEVADTTAVETAPVVEVVSKDTPEVTNYEPDSGEAELDKQIKVVKASGRKAAADLWKMALAFNTIKTEELWKFRQGEKYTNFEKFCSAELGVSRVYVNRLVDTSQQYTEAEFVDIGPHRLHTIMTAPKAQQQKLLDSAKKGASKATLSKEAQALVEDKPKPIPPPSAMTLSVVKPYLKLKMYARPTDAGSVGELTTRAKSISQEPFAKEVLADGKTIYYRIIQEQSGELFLIRDIRDGKDALDD